MRQAPQSPLPKLLTEFPVAVSAIPSRAGDGRLRKHADYQRVYRATRKQFSPNGTEPAPAGPRVGLTAGKVLGKAHERNRIKRRMREVVRHHIHLLPDGVDLVLHPRRSVMTMEFTKLETEVLRIFRQASEQIRSAATRPNA